MEIGDLVRPAQVIADLRARDKAGLTAELSRRAAAALQIDSHSVEDTAGNEHVAALAAISRRMRDAAFAQRLRKAAGAEEMYAILTDAAA